MKAVMTIGIVLCFFSSAAQHKKKFFDAVYFSVVAGGQVYENSLAQWKNMYANRSTIPYLLDTMIVTAIPKDGPILRIKANGAFSIMLSKALINKSTGWMHNKKLEWRTGFYYKNIRHNPLGGWFVNFYYPVDTTKANTNNNVLLEQTKHLLEWQNLINFKTGPFFNNKLRFNIGNGIGLSRTLKNVIHEKYYKTTYTWITAQQLFSQQDSPVTSTDFKAKPETHLAYILYLGTELTLSKQLSLTGDFHYSIASYKYNNNSPIIESYWLGLTLRYGLNQ